MRRSPEDMNVVKQAIAALEMNGRITPKGVVKAARLKTSALHEYFEWDDSVAAELHREQQARELIGWVKLEVTTTKGEVTTVQMYVHDPDCIPTNEPGYISTSVLKRSPVDSRKLLLYELARAEAYVVRVEELVGVLRMTGDPVVKSSVRMVRKGLTVLTARVNGVSTHRMPSRAAAG